jgi:predicted NAD/FAD-binding protein
MQIGFRGLVVALIAICAVFLLFPHPKATSGRVAVVGGGIAGAAAAWSLAQSGRYSVELFESTNSLGGNAKTQLWDVGGKPVRTGLSVLAWPKIYFKNYRSLLGRLGIETDAVNLKFLVHDTEMGYVGHGTSGNLTKHFERDFAAWAKARDTVRSANDFFNAADTQDVSLYRLSFFNPFNLLSVRTVCTFYGVSEEFWRTVVVSIYSSTFLTTKLDDVPAVIMPIIDDLIGLSHMPIMDTWSHSSDVVFERLTRHANITVHLNAPVVGVRTLLKDDSTNSANSANIANISVHYRKGDSATAEKADFSHIVWACPAHQALAALQAGPGEKQQGQATWLEWALLGLVQYTSSYDDSYDRGIVHSDTSLLPTEEGEGGVAWKEELLEQFSNYIKIGPREEGGGRSYENTFILGSWVPVVQRMKDTASAAAVPPMLVTYNPQTKIDPALVVGEVQNEANHPCLNVVNLALAFLLRLLQGGHAGSHYFCGAHTTPGNGHDLSLLSGLIAANAIGAEYPFDQAGEGVDKVLEAKAHADFGRLQAIMGI